MARLLAGDTATGWPLYEARLERAEFPRVKPHGAVVARRAGGGEKIAARRGAGARRYDPVLPLRHTACARRRGYHMAGARAVAAVAGRKPAGPRSDRRRRPGRGRGTAREPDFWLPLFVAAAGDAEAQFRRCATRALSARAKRAGLAQCEKGQAQDRHRLVRLADA